MFEAREIPESINAALFNRDQLNFAHKNSTYKRLDHKFSQFG